MLRALLWKVVDLSFSVYRMAEDFYEFRQTRGKQPYVTDDAVKMALFDHFQRRIESTGGPVHIPSVIFEFMMWHGEENLRKGILRPTPPPYADLAYLTPMGEA